MYVISTCLHPSYVYIPAYLQPAFLLAACHTNPNQHYGSKANGGELSLPVRYLLATFVILSSCANKSRIAVVILSHLANCSAFAAEARMDHSVSYLLVVYTQRLLCTSWLDLPRKRAIQLLVPVEISRLCSILALLVSCKIMTSLAHSVCMVFSEARYKLEQAIGNRDIDMDPFYLRLDDI